MAKPLFNSLGVNYSFGQAVLALSRLSSSSPKSLELLKKRLSQRFSGDVYCVYKGRDAIELTLRCLQLPLGTVVLTQAAACQAVEEGILRAKLKPGYVDVAKDEVAPGMKEWQAALHHFPEAKVVFVQHILGYANPIEELQKFCHQHKLILIEDLAQSVGASAENGGELGSFGDAVIFSFGRDKVLDGISGGAVALKASFWEKNIHQNEAKIELEQILFTAGYPSKLTQLKDLSYPLLCWVIRRTLNLGLGKLLLQIAKLTGWMRSPLESATHQITLLPSRYAPLILDQLDQLTAQLHHRQQLANTYRQLLTSVKDIQFPKSVEQKGGVHLRVPILVKDPDKLAKKLTTQGMYLTDRWYRQPVDGGRSRTSSIYQKGSCPNAEALTSQILNLPTHLRFSNDYCIAIAQAIQLTLQR